MYRGVPLLTVVPGKVRDENAARGEASILARNTTLNGKKAMDRHMPTPADLRPRGFRFSLRRWSLDKR